MNSASSALAVSSKIPTLARGFLKLMSKLQAGSVELITPDGELIQFTGSSHGPHAQLRIHDWSACAAILRSGDIGVAESYRDGKIDTPDLLSVLMLALANLETLEKTLHGSFLGTFFYRLRHLMNRNTRSGSKKNIHMHYDIGNSFYKLWLDPSMTYSAAIFSDEAESLEDAQLRKYDRILDMLEVKSGDRILEIGCGWGAFAERAATRGCHVTGISLSREQLAYARQRVKGSQSEIYTQFSFMDYRDLQGQYDAIVSIEMLEAVGLSYWPSYFRKIQECLKPGGKAALQSITIDETLFDDYKRGTDFIQQYIFPGGMLPSPTVLKQQITSAGMSMDTPFFFGKYYATTLRRWRAAFEDNLDALRQQGFDEAFIRLWRFYLCYCEAGFLTERTNVCQFMIRR